MRLRVRGKADPGCRVWYRRSVPNSEGGLLQEVWGSFLCLFSQKERLLNLEMRQHDRNDLKQSAPPGQGPSGKKGHTCIGRPLSHLSIALCRQT